jgi:anthranilate/para-aminobenzoate synthase component II
MSTARKGRLTDEAKRADRTNETKHKVNSTQAFPNPDQTHSVLAVNVFNFDEIFFISPGPNRPKDISRSSIPT